MSIWWITNSRSPYNTHIFQRTGMHTLVEYSNTHITTYTPIWLHSREIHCFVFQLIFIRPLFYARQHIQFENVVYCCSFFENSAHKFLELSALLFHNSDTHSYGSVLEFSLPQQHAYIVHVPSSSCYRITQWFGMEDTTGATTTTPITTRPITIRQTQNSSTAAVNRP